MNLYLFNDNDSAAIYGIGTYLNELTHALKGSDIHIHIVHLHSVRHEFEIVKTDGIEHWYIPELQNQNTFSAPVLKVEEYCLNVFHLLRLQIKDTKDLIFHFNFNLYQLLAKELKTFFNCKTVTTIHFMKWALELQGNLSRFHAIKKKPEDKRTAYEQILCKTDEYEKLLYKEVDKVIVLSKYTKSLLCREYRINPDKITLIPNGLQDINPAMETDRIVLRRKWGISENEILILFCGRINGVKGVGFLISAFKDVLNKNPHCRLMIAGDGDHKTYLTACDDISDFVTWTGFLNKDRLCELYSIADIGVIPSFHEQCSYVAIEMMRHKLPIIGSTSTGLKEMIVDGDTGQHIRVIEYNDKSVFDSTLLSEKILHLIENADEWQRMGQKTRKRFEVQYSMDLFRTKMLFLYQSLFEENNMFKKQETYNSERPQMLNKNKIMLNFV